MNNEPNNNGISNLLSLSKANFLAVIFDNKIVLPTPAMKNMSKDEKYSVQLKQGRPIYGVELKVVDDKGNELPKDGESQGHLMVRGPWILQKYFKSNEDAVDADGWFDTGDISVLDEDGYSALVGNP